MKMNQGLKVSSVQTVASACIASCQKLAAGIGRVRNHLLAEFQETVKVPDQLFRQALVEAEALAWQTEYPQLVFPELAMEKVQAVAAWHHRQQSMVHHRSLQRLAA